MTERTINDMGVKPTPKQARFVQEYLVDLNGTRAYKTAYPAVKKDETAMAAASRLLRNVKVQAAIADGQEKRQERTRVDQDTVIENLLRLAKKAEDQDRYGDALRAWEILARHVRLFSDSVDVNVTQPPALVINFTRPEKQISRPEMPALEEGL